MSSSYRGVICGDGTSGVSHVDPRMTVTTSVISVNRVRNGSGQVCIIVRANLLRKMEYTGTGKKAQGTIGNKSTRARKASDFRMKKV
jgi:hypothetical protein